MTLFLSRTPGPLHSLAREVPRCRSGGVSSDQPQLGAMSTRLSFRPRPLDLNKPLTIVRDINELDAADGLVSRDITHQHEALDKDNEEVWLASHSITPVSKLPFCRSASETYLRDFAACIALDFWK